MLGPRIALVLMGALIGSFVGVLIGLWGKNETGAGDVMALGDGFRGAVIGGLLGIAIGVVAAVLWRSPNR